MRFSHDYYYNVGSKSLPSSGGTISTTTIFDEMEGYQYNGRRNWGYSMLSEAWDRPTTLNTESVEFAGWKDDTVCGVPHEPEIWIWKENHNAESDSTPHLCCGYFHSALHRSSDGRERTQRRKGWSRRQFVIIDVKEMNIIMKEWKEI